MDLIIVVLLSCMLSCMIVFPILFLRQKKKQHIELIEILKELKK